MRVTIRPGRAAGRVAAPASKSYAHRFLLGAALSDGESVLTAVPDGDDVAATLDGIAALGAVSRHTGTAVTVTGRGGAPLSRHTGAPCGEAALPQFPCRESGSTFRFLLPLSLALAGGGHFTGSARLLERGVSVYEALLAPRGVRFVHGDGGLTVTGTLRPGAYALPGDVSSQFVTGLFYALPLLAGESVLRVLSPVESARYIDMSRETLRAFGVHSEEVAPHTYRIPGGQRYAPVTAAVEGDWSGGAFLHALNALGGDVTVAGLAPDSLQGDRVCLAAFAHLRAGFATVDIADCPDLGPVLFAVAAGLHGAILTGTRRLAIKESDRAAVMAAELRKCGADCVVEENRVTVRPGALRPPATPLSGHGDHRVVMALAVLLSRLGGQIDGAEAVAKSYPAFFDDLRTLGLEVTEDA